MILEANGKLCYFIFDRPEKKLSANKSGIRKVIKLKNVKRVKNDDSILESLKQELREQNVLKKPIPNRQLVWNAYLRTFCEVEKLNKKQKQIMDFCTNKSRTPPKRKRKFLVNTVSIRNSFPPFDYCLWTT